jgi:glucosyl-3-phosphoglycerate synthase
MPDFYQHARLPTLHHLVNGDPAARELELTTWVESRPLCLLLPALYSEFSKKALPRMLREIAEVPYISEVVLSINEASAQQVETATQICGECLGAKPFKLLWNDGPGVQAIYAQLAASGGPAYRAGKGSNIWLGLAYLLARGDHKIVASHDTDILSYERGMLWRLCFPVAHPEMPYRFAKGYYGRVGDRLYGRVTRLLVYPLLQAFAEVLGRTPIIEHLSSFRYPLSGEFCAELETLGRFPLPTGWGLEIYLLSECFSKLAAADICQVDLGFNFQHRHRKLSNAPAVSQAAKTGLTSSATEVSRAIIEHVLKGSAAGKETLLAVAEHYLQTAKEWVPRYEHDALFNGLQYDRKDELHAVELFARTLDGVVGSTETTTSLPAPMELLALPGMREALLALG